MHYEIDRQAGIANRGNLSRMKRLMARAMRGEALKLAFLGGSITQGCLASEPKLCYAARVFDWWVQTFPQSQFTYINAGIGGTTSQYGTARVQKDVLDEEPDFVIVEFSVNDDSTELFLETYEGLIRKIWSASCTPVIMLVHNVRYDDGGNAQIQHAKIARHYNLPSVSMQSAIYPKVVSGEIPNRDITEDDLHPNDTGHALVAEVITYFLECVHGVMESEETEPTELPEPLTQNCYEHAVCCRNNYGLVWPDGFEADRTPQDGITDVFKNGWTAITPGACIRFEVRGSEIAVQYRKSLQKPAPVAQVVIDGDAAHAILLDANFTEDWGDCLYITTVLRHGEKRTHQVEITLTDCVKEAAVPFYLASVIVSG